MDVFEDTDPRIIITYVGHNTIYISIFLMNSVQSTKYIFFLWYLYITYISDLQKMKFVIFP